MGILAISSGSVSLVLNSEGPPVQSGDPQQPVPSGVLSNTGSHETAVPNFVANPTKTSAATGNWSSAATWTPSGVPGLNDVVNIANGHTVTYDVVSDVSISSIGILSGGILTHAVGANTRLTCVQITVMLGGIYRVGTTAAPIQSGFTAEVVFSDVDYDDVNDQHEWSNGIICLGEFRSCGQTKDSFKRLSGNLAAAATSVPFSTAAVGWLPGDRLLFPDSRQSYSAHAADNYAAHWETKLLNAMGGGNTSCTLTAGLTWSHDGATDAGGTYDRYAHVGNLTRNVVFRSANPTGRRPHFIAIHRADVDTRYTEYRDTGRSRSRVPTTSTPNGANRLGRYGGWHFHHDIGPSSIPASGWQGVVKGCAIHITDDVTHSVDVMWGITLHHSSWILVEDNIIFRHTGSGIMTETGDEKECMIRRNLVCATIGMSGFNNQPDRGDGRQALNQWGHDGSGIWMRGSQNRLIDNVCTNSHMYGLTYFTSVNTVTLPNTQGVDPAVSGTTLDMQTLAILECSGNEIYGRTHTGVSIWNIGVGGATEINLSQPRSVLQGMITWHTEHFAYFGYPCYNFLFDGWVHRGYLPAIHEGGVCLHFGDYLTGLHDFENCDIQGARTGVTMPVKVGQFFYTGHTPQQVNFTNCNFRNYQNISMQTMFATTGGGTAQAPRESNFTNCIMSEPNVSQSSGPFYDVLLLYHDAGYPQLNLTRSDVFRIFNHNGVAADDYRLYFTQQRSDYIVPQTSGLGTENEYIGSPSAGLTNLENRDLHGVSAVIGGAIAPTTTTMAKFYNAYVQDI